MPEAEETSMRPGPLILIALAALVVFAAALLWRQSEDRAEPSSVQRPARPQPPPADAGLHAAVRSGNIEEVRRLLDEGRDPNALGARRQTPLHAAAGMGHVAIAQLLLERGADVNAIGPNGVTPLHAAVGRGQEAVVELLLANGANAEAADQAGRTPLRIARQAGQKEIVRLLQEHAAGR